MPVTPTCRPCCGISRSRAWTASSSISDCRRTNWSTGSAVSAFSAADRSTCVSTAQPENRRGNGLPNSMRRPWPTCSGSTGRSDTVDRLRARLTNWCRAEIRSRPRTSWRPSTAPCRAVRGGNHADTRQRGFFRRCGSTRTRNWNTCSGPWTAPSTSVWRRKVGSLC